VQRTEVLAWHDEGESNVACIVQKDVPMHAHSFLTANCILCVWSCQSVHVYWGYLFWLFLVRDMLLAGQSRDI
jgi:hypothetical protein